MKNQGKRITGTEQYYTPLSTAIECVKDMKVLLQDTPDLWIEPSGGTGNFIEALISSGVFSSNIISWDILPLHPLVKPTDDFLTENLSYITSGKRVVAIGNPPFGRCHSLSVKFFNKLADYCNYIGFIIPVSWRKWSILNRLDTRFHLALDQDLKINYLGDNVKSNNRLNTCFQVYERRSENRKKVKIEDRGYVTKVSQQEADVSLTVFGVYGRKCGEVFDDPFEVKPGTQIFLKLNEPWVRTALDEVDYSQFCSNNALSSAQSLSFQELLFLLNTWKDS